MPTQPKALLLADELEDMTCLWSPSVNRARVDKAAAELRRLHELLEAEQTLHQRVIYPELQRLRAQRDVLLEALQDLCDTLGECGMTEKARAVIKKVQEGD